MTGEDARSTVIQYWLDKAAEALASAGAEYEAGRYSGDYQDLVSFDTEQVAELCGEARGFVRQMLGLLER